ncbi:lytic murein transglycosylase [Peteryoungia desertarenae]|uniref:Lytic murein transglycosylase n=1 Tax=Peteryoungia desertarenae TaxID=1813451 RepID=A0ABX6QKB3_9HYPH|nr:lytic murein transglycosylase [Peteryoungia desertarenae]QLF69004.1 lytic murein transglycosylase [Peteryoungia desertarenae]
MGLKKALLSCLALTTALWVGLVPETAAAAPRAEVEAQFRQWIATDLWREAEAAGVSKAAFDRILSDIRLNWDLPDLVPPGTEPPKARPQSQAEFSSPGAYFNEKRLQDLAAIGRSLARQHAATLKRIEAAYGVPGEIIIAVWGRESGYGRARLPHAAIDVLATKAFMSTRPDLFRRELISALHIIEGGDITAERMMGSWAGALGQPQFMPTSYLRFAVDFDVDGHRDIWNSVPDSLASIGNYLAKSGWQTGRGWAYEISIPEGVSCAQEGPDRAQPLSFWEQQGIRRISGPAFPAAEAGKDMMMLVPAGTKGPEFLVTPNFYVLKEYNNSDLYALFIGNLADRIANGSGAFETRWGDVGKMLRSDVLKMQQSLVAKGYDVGRVDGLAGFKTRRSIGEWQKSAGLSPTCFPDASLKGRL